MTSIIICKFTIQQQTKTNHEDYIEELSKDQLNKNTILLTIVYL